MRRRCLPRSLDGVVRDAPIAIDLSKRMQRKLFRRHERRRLPLRVDGAEEEQAVVHDRTAERGADVAQSCRDGVDGALDAVHGVVVGFEAVRTDVSEPAAFERVAAALRDNVDHPAGGLSELRLVAARLHLDFLHEVIRRAVAERAKHDRIRPQRAVAAIGDVHAIDDILVLEPARSAD